LAPLNRIMPVSKPCSPFWYWVRIAQQEAFGDELASLSLGHPLPRRSKLLPLRPILDGSILRVGGRIDRALVSYGTRHQILLPSEHHLTLLIVRDAHHRLAHGPTSTIMAEIRQNFWVPRLKQLVKRAASECLQCRKIKSEPAVPLMAELPDARLSFGNPPFTHCGVDYFGPILIKQGRKRLKRWVALFTCLTTRAIHIEIVESLESDAFINAFRRFLCRRGPVSHMYSDNGTSFVGADKELRRAIKQINSSEAPDILSRRGTQWHFIPPRAPHMGGAWERLVRSVKASLRAIFRDACVHEPTLHTTLVEIEHMVNSRPLARSVPPNCDPEPTKLEPRKRWRHSQILSKALWKRWCREYLPSLNVSYKWRTDNRKVEVNDLVLVVDQQAPRCSWLLGRVSETFKGRDDRVRVVTLRTKNGTLTRPVSRICFLECDSGRK